MFCVPFDLLHLLQLISGQPIRDVRLQAEPLLAKRSVFAGAFRSGEFVIVKYRIQRIHNFTSRFTSYILHLNRLKCIVI
jgi:hypothetical protein